MNSRHSVKEPTHELIYSHASSQPRRKTHQVNENSIHKQNRNFTTMPEQPGTQPISFPEASEQYSERDGAGGYRQTSQETNNHIYQA